jgi:hypothetical protein
MAQLKYSVTGRTMTLSHETTVDYEDKGPVGDKTRREVRADAQVLADQLGKPIEIMASDDDGGWTAEQIRPSSETSDA